MTATSCHCGRQWTGLAQCHCRTCHRHFGSAAGFDRHRGSGKCADPSKDPYFSTEENAYGVTYIRDDPRGHYRNDG